MRASASAPVLSLDIGTSSVKAGLVEPDGRLAWFMHDPILGARASLTDWDPRVWVDSLSRVVVRLYRERPGQALAAVALSGHGPTLVPLDAEDRPTAAALHWIDRRRLDLPGNRSFYLPKAAWFRAERPQAFARTARFLSCPEYLNLLLTGRAATVCPGERFRPYIWTGADIERYGFDPALFPPMVAPGEPCGAVTAQAAARFGLPAGLPVFAAGSDFMMSLAGTATVHPGRICDRAGSSEGLNYCSEKEIQNDAFRVLPHVAADYYNVAGILASTGLLFEWFRSVSGQATRAYEDTMADIRALPVDGGLPWFVPDLADPAAADFAGGAFWGLRPEHGPAELGHAVVESIAFAVRASLDAMEAAGLASGELRLCGGQAKNRHWVALKADISGRAMLVPEVPDAELVGSAVFAQIGLGRYPDLATASGSMVRVASRVEPDPARAARYAERYAEYRELRRRLAGAAG